MFLVFAWTNVDRLRGLGLHHAPWRSSAGTNWVCAVVTGIVAGIAVFAIGTLAGQNMRLSDDWNLVALQVTLGPVLEEVVFRGYLFAFLKWSFSRMANGTGRNRLVWCSRLWSLPSFIWHNRGSVGCSWRVSRQQERCTGGLGVALDRRCHRRSLTRPTI